MPKNSLHCRPMHNRKPNVKQDLRQFHAPDLPSNFFSRVHDHRGSVKNFLQLKQQPRSSQTTLARPPKPKS
jgi:hypothetical protein